MNQSAILRQGRTVPAEHQSNFRHLYWDIAWYGVLSGSAISFAAVYLARLGGNALQLGLLSASPAMVGLLFTLPIGQMLSHGRIDRSVFWTSVLHRMFYLPWIFLPLLLSNQVQIWLLILLTLLMSIPGTALSVGFNAMFAAAVPPEWRGQVAGTRNALLAIAFIVTSLLCGLLLDRLPYPVGYQAVFAIGFVGAVMSSVHLWFVRPLNTAVAISSQPTTRDLAGPGRMRAWGQSMRGSVGLRSMRRLNLRNLAQPDVLRNGFWQIVLLLFGFHLAQYLAIPLFPLYWVDRLNLSDQAISLGNAVFYAAVLVGSMQLARLTAAHSNRRLMAFGVGLMSLYPLLTAVSQTLAVFLITAVVGGVAWSIVGGVIANYVLEKTPDSANRPAYLAWYNLALNGAILLGSLGGPLLVAPLGLVTVLLIAAFGRFLAALAFWRWG